MKLIQSIDSIYPTEIAFSLKKLEEKLQTNIEIEIQLGVTIEDFKKDDQGNFRAVVTFMLADGGLENGDVLFKLSHQIDFTSLDGNFNIKDRDHNFALFEIIEPYVRYRFKDLTSQTQFSSLEIPYKFWEMSSKNSNV
ncbi:hypothetical protein [Streptococcus suis]|uniref:hypothetical protein n=1 Tax=Streptococcus suis TaxID=1307 RepID=UPI001478F9DC